jgi:hypothetical protein
MRKRYRSKDPGARKETLGNVREFFYLERLSYIYSIQKGRYGPRVRNGRGNVIFSKTLRNVREFLFVARKSYIYSIQIRIRPKGQEREGRAGLTLTVKKR